MKKVVSGFFILSLVAAGIFVRSRESSSSAQSVQAVASERSPASEKEKAEKPVEKSAVAHKSVSRGVTPPEIAEISRLRDCLQSEACDYPQTDPQSYSLAIGQEVKRNLKDLADRLKEDPSLSAEAEKLAREWATNPDGHIQEGALAVFAELPPSPENLRALVEGLQLNPADPLILKQASEELARYMGTAQEKIVHQFLSKTLTEGALFTSQQAGLVLRRFLTPQSAGYYRQLLKTLPEDSTKARYLRGTLEEYERHTEGG